MWVTLLVRLIACGSLIAALEGCTKGSLARECEPSAQVGCRAGERCALSEEGIPSCLPVNPDGLQEGAHCQLSEDCADGLGCLSLFGVQQCARFCPLDQSQASADQQCVRGSSFARCLAALPSRTDIGVCLTPCDPFSRGLELLSCDPAQGVTCGVNVDLSFLVCLPEGPRAELERCDPSARCAHGLLCLQEGSEQRCLKPLAFGERCADNQLKRPVFGRYDPLSEEAISACWPSVSLPQSVTRELRYRLHLGAVDSPEDRALRCAEWGGVVASLEPPGLLESLSAPLGVTLAELNLSRSSEEGELRGAWVRAVAEGEELCVSLTFEGEADARSASATLSDAGACEPSWPTICALPNEGSLE